MTATVTDYDTQISTYDDQETGHDMSSYSRIITSPSLPIPLPDIDSLDDLMFKMPSHKRPIKLANLIKKIQDAKQDAGVYKPLAQLLTAISLSMWGNDSTVLAFIVTPETAVKPTEDSTQKPDVIGIMATGEEAQQILVNPDFKPSALVTPYDIRAPIEAKQEPQALYQCLRYITSTHIHRPQAIVCHGLSVTKQYVMLRSVGLSSLKDGEKILWTIRWKPQISSAISST